jgi:uncharacterized membrane protein
MVSFFCLLSVLLISKTPPEKEINKFTGFRTKESMKNQRNWDIAQREMIGFARKLILPSIILGCFFSVVEFYFLFVEHAENMFILLLLIEVILSVIMFILLYQHVKRCMKS